jgi:hypothetical protein
MLEHLAPASRYPTDRTYRTDYFSISVLSKAFSRTYKKSQGLEANLMLVIISHLAKSQSHHATMADFLRKRTWVRARSQRLTCDITL